MPSFVTPMFGLTIFQGLADTFCLLRLPFVSDEAKKLNRDIFETMYFAALSASNAQAVKEGHYETYPGSPASKVCVILPIRCSFAPISLKNIFTKQHRVCFSLTFGTSSHLIAGTGQSSRRKSPSMAFVTLYFLHLCRPLRRLRYTPIFRRSSEP